MAPAGSAVVELLGMTFDSACRPDATVPVLSNYLVESAGDLLLVESNDDNVMVFRTDSSRNRWERVERLVDRVLFVDRVCSLSLPAASVGGGENCVYLTRGEYNDALMVFDLGTGSAVHGLLICNAHPCSRGFSIAPGLDSL